MIQVDPGESRLIYLDTSVALAMLLHEDRRPPDELWDQTLVSSRLLQYEVWSRVHAYNLVPSHGAEVSAFLTGVSFIELTPDVLVRALDALPKPVRTLDALHLASMDFLRRQGQVITLASYDDRFLAAARQMKFEVAEL